MDYKEFNENFKLNPLPPVKKVELEDEAHLKKYIMWENKSNICWLDASMALVAHNRVMKRYSVVNPACRISKIISAYDEAIRILNSSEKSLDQRKNLAKGKLNYIQESTLQYLQPILKYKTGDPESAFCSLYNLLIQDSSIKQIFDVTWISVKECTDCGNHSESKTSKPIVTLDEIDTFVPENQTVLYHCRICNRPDQKLKLIYVSLPPCLIFHFEKGAGKERPPLNFAIREREYYLTGIMTLEKSADSRVNHFITWVRDPSVNKWLDCNDLQLDIISFSPDFPAIKFEDVHMYVYESFDDLGKITVAKIIKIKKSEENITCIDLLEDSDTDNSISQNTATESNKDTGKRKTLESDLVSSSDKIKLPELNSNTTSKRSLSTYNKGNTDKNIQHVNFTQHLKNASTDTVCVNSNESQLEPIETDKDKVQGKTDKNEVLKTWKISPDINLTPADGSSAKKINKNICKPDFSDRNDTITAKIDANRCLSPNTKEALEKCKVSPVSENKYKNSKIKCRQSTKAIKDSLQELSSEEDMELADQKSAKWIKSRDLIKIKNRQSVKTIKNILQNEVSSEEDMEFANQKSVKWIKSRDSIKIKNNDKINMEKNNINNSEQIFTSTNAKQSNKRLVLNPNVEHIRSGQFLSDATANSSGTSYLKVLLRRKKSSSHQLYEKNIKDDADNPDSNETLHDAINTPSSVKSLKRSRVDGDCVPSAMLGKKKKLSNMERNTINTKGMDHYSKDQEKAVKNEPKKKSRGKSNLNCTNKRTMLNCSLNTTKQEEKLNDHSELLSEQDIQTGAVSEGENHGKILKNFEYVWACHKSGCDCDCADLEETIDTVVDYTFAYLCKLSQECKKLNTE